MQKEIKEDFTIFWPFFYAITAVVVIFFLVAGISSIFILHDWSPFALLVGVSIFAVWYMRFALHTSRERAEASSRRWLQADDGLVRLYDSGKQETIHWEQVRDMRWGKHVGLKIRWEESKHEHRLPEFRNEFRRWETGRYECWIRVREAEARELFRCAKRDWFNIRL